MELVVLKPIKPSDMLALSQLSGTVGKPHQWLENQLSTTGHSVPHMMCLRKTSHVCSKWGGSEVVLRVFFHSFPFFHSFEVVLISTSMLLVPRHRWSHLRRPFFEALGCRTASWPWRRRKSSESGFSGEPLRCTSKNYSACLFIYSRF